MSETLKEALRLRELGFAVHWLQPRTKIPLLSGWATAPVPSLEELERTYREGFNVGFRAGKYSIVDGREVCVLDVDIKDPTYAEEAYACANVILKGGFLPEVTTGSGDGRHQYIRFPLGGSPKKAATTLRHSDVWVLGGKPCASSMKGARPAWVIELLSTGKNVVAPPSIHPATGKPYIWRKDESA